MKKSIKKLTTCILLATALLANKPNANAQSSDILSARTANAHIMATGNVRGLNFYALGGGALSGNTNFIPHFGYAEVGASKRLGNFGANLRLGAEAYNNAPEFNNQYGELSLNKKLGRFTLNIGVIGKTNADLHMIEYSRRPMMEFIAPWTRLDMNILEHRNGSLNAQLGVAVDGNEVFQKPDECCRFFIRPNIVPLALVRYTRRIGNNTTVNASLSLNDPLYAGTKLTNSFWRAGLGASFDIPPNRAQRRGQERPIRRSRINTSVTGGAIQHGMVISN